CALPISTAYSPIKSRVEFPTIRGKLFAAADVHVVGNHNAVIVIDKRQPIGISAERVDKILSRLIEPAAEEGTVVRKIQPLTVVGIVLIASALIADLLHGEHCFGTAGFLCRLEVIP